MARKTRDKNWNSLKEFKDFLQEEGKEKILNFVGYEIVTNKSTYRLYDSRIIIVDNEKKK